MKGERRATCGQEIPTKTRGGRERAGAIAAGIRVKGADLTEDPIDVYSFRHNANSGFLHRSPHILLLFFFSSSPLEESCFVSQSGADSWSLLCVSAFAFLCPRRMWTSPLLTPSIPSISLVRMHLDSRKLQVYGGV